METLDRPNWRERTANRFVSWFVGYNPNDDNNEGRLPTIDMTTAEGSGFFDGLGVGTAAQHRQEILDKLDTLRQRQ